MKESRRTTPLRTILQNCLNHIENLETNRSTSDNYDKEFQDLKQFSETLKAQKEFSCTEGEKEVNKKKNRYKDILPFNISRVILSEYAGIPGSDYINANFIKGASGSPAYIASQGPLPNTVNDFWRMVVECEVQVIVMACNAQESGKHKCENYWVEKEGEEKRFGMVQICLVKASAVCPDFLVRTMRLKYINDKDVTEERTVCQFHYSAWPDHGVPPLVRPLLDMVRLVRDTQASETLPVLVHCSAGCGRTGTICAIDFVWGLLRAGKLTEEFSLFNLVKDMRKQRVAMVQTKEQYILVHQAVRELFKEQLQVIESHPYENIDFNGVPLIKDFEEPFYDTICVQKEENCDEKQDRSELKEKGEDIENRLVKVDTAPPLPRKKKPNVSFSKQEKEAENLTEKNRSSFVEKEKNDASLSSLLGKPRIVRLRALFEKSTIAKERTALKDKGSQTVSRSHSLGAIRKPLITEIFDPQIEKNKCSNSTIREPIKVKNSKSFSKAVPLIKRSKSLKTFSHSSHLCVSPPNSSDHEVIKNCQSKSYKSENYMINKMENSWNASYSFCDVPQASNLIKECSKRRRSLESLMGDVPPFITWPTVVEPSEKSNNNVKSRQKSLDWSLDKQNSTKFENSKTVDDFKVQLQRLSLETEKKKNTFASGIGIRERRNSFRQAVNKSDFQYVFQNYHEQQSSPGKKTLGKETYLDKSKIIKNSNEVLQLTNKTDCAIYLEREVPVDMKLIKSKIAFDNKKYTVQEKPPETINKFSIRLPSQPNSLASSQTVLQPQTHKRLMNSKTRTTEDLERNNDPKNLFLKKLNSELLSEREREYDINETRTRLSFEESNKPSVSRIAFNSILVHSDSRKPLCKTNSTMKPSGSYSVKSDNLDEPDKSNYVFHRTTDVENNEKVLKPSISQNFHGLQTYVNPQKNSPPLEPYKTYSAPSASHRTSYIKINSYKDVNYQNSNSEGMSNMRKEVPQEIRSKETFFSISHKKNICCAAPSKVHLSQENEVTFNSYRKNPSSNSDLYVPISSEFENNDKLMLPSKMIIVDKCSKNYDALQKSYPTSQMSSNELAFSDSKSEPPKLLNHYAIENPVKSEMKIVTNVEKAKNSNKIRLNDPIKKMQSCEKSNKQNRSEDLAQNSSIELCNYGILNISKSKQNSSKYSKDDFVLEEPMAPPRVKRHASITVPRNTINGSDHTSTWSSTDSKLNSNRNTNLEVEKDYWGDSFGVDLDAIAASIQQDKRDLSVLKDAAWSSINHLNTSSNPNVKKKQHYL